MVAPFPGLVPPIRRTLSSSIKPSCTKPTTNIRHSGGSLRRGSYACSVPHRRLRPSNFVEACMNGQSGRTADGRRRSIATAEIPKSCPSWNIEHNFDPKIDAVSATRLIRD